MADCMRRTSVYSLVLQGDDELLDTLAQRCGQAVTAALIDGSTITLRYRVADDARALELAEDLTEGRSYELTTGVAVNKRDVLHG